MDNPMLELQFCAQLCSIVDLVPMVPMVPITSNHPKRNSLPDSPDPCLLRNPI